MQCQYVNHVTGQCKREAAPGLANCAIHTEHATFSDHDELRTIREEIAIARTLLEERLNTIKTDADLIAACGPLNTLLLTIERLTTSCLKLDTTVGNLMAKPTLLRIASDTVAIILQELKDIPNHEEIVDKISKRMVDVMDSAEE